MNISKKNLIKSIYLYLVSLIALILIITSTIGLINLGLKTWFFPQADSDTYKEPPCELTISKIPNQTQEEYQKQVKLCQFNREQNNRNKYKTIARQRELVRDISMLLVGIPLFIIHWFFIRRDEKKEQLKKE